MQEVFEVVEIDEPSGGKPSSFSIGVCKKKVIKGFTRVPTKRTSGVVEGKIQFRHSLVGMLS